MFTTIIALMLVQDAEPQKVRKPPVLEALERRTDELSFDNFLKRSTVEAERFRRDLLRIPDGRKTSKAATIAKASDDFRLAVESQVKEATSGRYSLGRFALAPEQIVGAIAGARPLPDPKQFYGSFEGKWYGVWDKRKVDHHWGSYVPGAPVRDYTVDGKSVRLDGYQYAWVGDGYGLNHVCSSADGKQKYLLGYVVHIRDQNVEQEVVRRPHVGVIDGTDRLIWITKGEVFFEEAIRTGDPSTHRYYITGFNYAWKDDAVTTIRDGFMAVYSRDPSRREPWRRLSVAKAPVTTKSAADK